MKILVINGPNINMLGIREPELYGKSDYVALKNLVKMYAEYKHITIDMVQSNHEGVLIDYIQDAYQKYDGIIINAGGYTHTSIAILDALKAVSIPTVEVHITDIAHREAFRANSYISHYALKSIIGKGINGYVEAIEFLCETLEKRGK